MAYQCYTRTMVLVGLLSWWYSDGIIKRMQIISARFIFLADFFSTGRLLSTLFAPYKQISSEQTTETFNEQFRAFFDGIISRAVGATLRSSMIIIGLIVLLCQVIFGAISIVFWLIMPILPIVGIYLTLIGWLPI